MDGQANTGKTLIVSFTEGFLAKSLLTKLTDADIPAAIATADIKEIKKHADNMELVVLFLSEELETVPETLVYLKDTIQDKELGLILIGDEDQYAQIMKTFPETAVTEWFKRPLDIDKLVKRVSVYLDENTGDKRKKTVLIVDDDITYMRTVYEWLKDSYHVGILLDYEMPIANGPQVLSMLKNDSDTGQIPVMFLTGHGDKESVLSVVGLSPVDYLLKTIDKATLLDKLNTFFAR